MLKVVLAFALLLAECQGFAVAQVNPEKMAPARLPKISQPLPFKPGETLIYDVSFSKFIFGGTIGELKLWVSKAPESSKPGLIELQAEAVSKGFFPKLFGVKVKDRFESVVTSEDFGLHTSTKHVEEGKVQREQKSVVNREAGRVTFTDRDLANKSAEPKVKQKDSPAWIQDLLSAIYFIRTQQLNTGDVIRIPVSEAGETYNIEVVVGKREEVKVDAGKFQAVCLDVKAFGGRYVRRSGEMYVWVSDDARRTPVRSKIKTSGATVSIELKKMK
jgi:hypothetical protein